MEWQMITSRQNPLVRSVCGLAEKKKRAESGLFRFDGIKLLGEALDAGMDVRHVIIRDGAPQRAVELAKAAQMSGAQVTLVSHEVFDKITEEKSPEGVIAVACAPRSLHSRACAEDICAVTSVAERILIVESLRDPGNLGTVIRSCYALGIDKLILTSDCADLYNPKTIRAAMGAIFRMPTLCVDVGELPAVITALRQDGRRIFATALDERSCDIGEIGLSVGDCFVIGNEGHGISDAVIAACTSTVIIPMREGAESLNAAAAAAICIWETVKCKEVRSQ